MIQFVPAFDKTHFITASAQPTDGRIQLGSLWSKTSTNELYICTSLSPVTFTLLTGGSGAPTGSTYVVMSLDGTLTAERVLTAGTGISIVDGGAGSTVTVSATGSTATAWRSHFLLMGS